MAGIYVHIPFCRKACHYCNFHFSTSLKLKNEFVSALLKEIEITGLPSSVGLTGRESSGYLHNEPVETIYFGGGTPSLLSHDELLSILTSIRAHHAVVADAEITLEANPDDISTEKLAPWKEVGINRLSLGVQSFFDEDLAWMNRAHDSRQAYDAIIRCQSLGFTNLTVDLIYGTPSLTDERWEKNLQTAISLNIPHLSCYALTVEPSTALQKLISTKKLEDVDPERQASQFQQLMKKAEDAGYEHYEISNFAKPGFRSRHNASYWEGKKYLGLGPSAHSFNGESRSWNISNNSLYIAALERGELPLETEILSETQRANEYIMTALRTIEGINLTLVENKYGKQVAESLHHHARKYVRMGRMKNTGQILQLTQEGKLFADGIAADLFI